MPSPHSLDERVDRGQQLRWRHSQVEGVAVQYAVSWYMSAFGPLLPAVIVVYLASITATGLSSLSYQVRSGSIAGGAAVIEVTCRTGSGAHSPAAPAGDRSSDGGHQEILKTLSTCRGRSLARRRSRCGARWTDATTTAMPSGSARSLSFAPGTVSAPAVGGVTSARARRPLANLACRRGGTTARNRAESRWQRPAAGFRRCLRPYSL